MSNPNPESIPMADLNSETRVLEELQEKNQRYKSKLALILKGFETAVFSFFTKQPAENILLHTVFCFAAFPVLVGFMALQAVMSWRHVHYERMKTDIKNRQLGWALVGAI